ncbi:MAG: ribonuclease HI, partial [Planctomycetes bacterium]|nr:ribonuclease HI [Planctomycetota bacterium]
ETVTLFTDGSYDRLTRHGGWAAILMAPSLASPVRGSGPLKRTTNNRAELIAVIRGLERLATPVHVHIVSDSKYVTFGIVEGVPKWKAQGWRAGSGRRKRTLQNADLWKKLDALMEPHSVNCEWVRGHSGDKWNEECDRLAVAAMERPAFFV